MQLISLAVAGLALAKVAIAAASIPTGLVNIVDFQGYGLNLVGGSSHAADGTAIIVYPGPFNYQANQQWYINPHGSAYTIANGIRPALQLSYPGAPYVNGSPYFAGLVVYTQFGANFTIQPAGNGFHIIENNSGQALTSWAAVAAQFETPVTLAYLSPYLTSQQTWNIVQA